MEPGMDFSAGQGGSTRPVGKRYLLICQQVLAKPGKAQALCTKEPRWYRERRRQETVMEGSSRTVMPRVSGLQCAVLIPMMRKLGPTGGSVLLKRQSQGWDSDLLAPQPSVSHHPAAAASLSLEDAPVL